jgi:hypothetical protein
MTVTSKEAGGATPGPLVQQWADDLTAHVGSDPVHPGLRPALRSDQPIARRTYRFYTALKSRRCDDRSLLLRPRRGYPC